MSEILLDVKHLKTYFPIKGGVIRKTVGYVRAVEDVSLTIQLGRRIRLRQIHNRQNHSAPD